MKRTIISAAVLGLGLAGIGVSSADPGPHHGNNAYGLCNAYFNGSEQGQEKKRNGQAFLGLEEESRDDDENTDTREEVAAFCAENGEKPGKGGGNSK